MIAPSLHPEPIRAQAVPRGRFAFGLTQRTIWLLAAGLLLALGASPRAAISLLRVAQAFAAFEDRDYLVPDDVKRAVLPVLRHRIMLKPEAELEGFDADRVLGDVVAAVAVPRR